MNNAPIGIFDSGFGGLTVARAIVNRLPNEQIVYFGDTLRCPYGPRSLEEVRGFVRQICTWLSTHDVKLIVIACNTATAAGLTMAQKEFDVPIIGVVEPGARAAVRATRNRKVGVIATQATVDSSAYSDAIRALDAGVTVFSEATPRFVEMVEDGLRKGDSFIEKATADASKVYLRPAFQEIARDYLDPLKKTGIDTLVMGCTHFPVITPLIGLTVGSDIKLISSADETAKDVAEVLEYRGHLHDETTPAPHLFASTSDDVEEFSRIGSLILGRDLGDVEHVDMEDPR